MSKDKFKKGDLIEVREEIFLKASPSITKGIMGVVTGFHSHATYNRAWYEVHFVDGRTMTMLDSGLKKVNK
jgi:hypothetical protein